MMIKYYMKKAMLLALFLTFCVTLVGCSNTMEKVVKDNMSDLRINFFEGNNDEYSVNISCGYREEAFAYDGVSTKHVECGVVSLEFNETKSYSYISIILTINDEEKEVLLEKSPYEEIFMADIEKIIHNDSSVSVKLKNQENVVHLTEKSSSWKIDYKKAISIGTNNFIKELNDLYFNSKLNAECYLKIITKNEFEKSYWFFSFVDRADNFTNCLIDVNTGEITQN